jgi:hypothetical protein
MVRRFGGLKEARMIRGLGICTYDSFRQNYIYVLKKLGLIEQVRLSAYDQYKSRLQNCSIYIYDGSNSTQIVILNEAYANQTGP